MAKFSANKFSGISLSNDNMSITITFTDDNEKILNLSFPVDQIERLLVQTMQLSRVAKANLGGLERGSLAIQTDGAGLALSEEVGEFGLILIIGGMEIVFAVDATVFLNISRSALQLAS